MAQKAFALVLLLAAMAATTDNAQNSPQDFLDLHNAARCAEGTGLTDVVWNTTLEQFTRSFAATRAARCDLTHSNVGVYGENLYAGPPDIVWTAAQSVALWVGEKRPYDYGINTCSDTATLCGHHGQVVWRDTTSIGCARVVCDNGGVFIICNYFLPDNFPNQRLY